MPVYNRCKFTLISQNYMSYKNIHLVLIQMTNGVIIYDTLLKLLPFRFNNYLILPIFTLPLRNIFSVLIIKSPLHLSQFFALILYSALKPRSVQPDCCANFSKIRKNITNFPCCRQFLEKSTRNLHLPFFMSKNIMLLAVCLFWSFIGGKIGEKYQFWTTLGQLPVGKFLKIEVPQAYVSHLWLNPHQIPAKPRNVQKLKEDQNLM